MDRTRQAGAAITTVGFAGYLAGVLASYPGRAFSVTALMVGITLFAVGAGTEGEP